MSLERRPETFVVGDIHGCGAELDDLMERAGFDPRHHNGILVGDLYTRGPDPRRVYDRIRELGLRAVVGNHEEHLLHLVRRILSGEKNIDTVRAGSRRAVDAFRSELDNLVSHLESLPYCIRSIGEDDRAWVVVHAGVHPVGGFDPADKRIMTRIRSWPPDDPVAPRWHELYTGEPLIIFGHDARHGLVVHRNGDGRPRAVGLDTGCVYGGRLTGYWIERDTLVSVPARKAYWGLPGRGRGEGNTDPGP